MGFIEFNDGSLGPVEEVTPEFWDQIQALTEQIRTIHLGPFAEVQQRHAAHRTTRAADERLAAVEFRLDALEEPRPPRYVVLPTPAEQQAILSAQIQDRLTSGQNAPRMLWPLKQ